MIKHPARQFRSAHSKLYSSEKDNIDSLSATEELLVVTCDV